MRPDLPIPLCRTLSAPCVEPDEAEPDRLPWPVAVPILGALAIGAWVLFAHLAYDLAVWLG